MIQITMPRLSDTMEDGVINAWLKQPGDQVAVGEPIVEIETDKAVMEFEAYDAGVLSKLLVSEGERVTIGTPIAEVDDGQGDEEMAPDLDASVPAGRPPEEVGAPPEASAAAGAAAPGPLPDQDAPTPRLRATPLVRALARKNGIDLSSVVGHGPGGRIIRADIEDLLAPAPETRSSIPTASPDAALHDRRDSEEVALSGIRRVIATRLTESARSVPHFYVTAVADVDELVTLRSQLSATLAEAGRPKVSINDLLVRACALALREHPGVNASHHDESDSILVHGRVHIGVAVAAEHGLVVPVVDDADQKTVTQVGSEVRRLVGLANERKLSPDQMSGSTFTISNLGMFGVEEFTAIINPPEGAILAVGATVREPSVVGDEVRIRHRMRYTLSADHRIIDGALAAQFLRTLTRLLENPWSIIA